MDEGAAEKIKRNRGVVSKIINWIFKKPPKLPILRHYRVRYLVSYGAMCIHTHEYKCLACCKYDAFLKFIKDTKDEDHYSDRSIRTPKGYLRWVNDIYRA